MNLPETSLIAHDTIDCLHDTIDRLHAAMETLPKGVDEVIHHFTPGMYAREYRAPKGSLVLSKIHKTEHQWVLLKGKVSVYWTDDSGVEQCVTFEAPYHGVTYPGTRRVLLVHEDIIWTTFHPTTLTSVDEIEDEIIEKHDNPYLEASCPGQLP